MKPLPQFMPHTDIRPIRAQATRVIAVLITCCLFLFPSCKEKQEKKNTPAADTKIEFAKKTFDFGDITEGETVSHTFFFKNTGEHNLIIRKIETGCGCTTVNYSDKPVKPGKEGKLEIAFNSSGRYGKQYKEIRIFANGPQKDITLKFSANVK